MKLCKDYSLQSFFLGGSNGQPVSLLPRDCLNKHQLLIWTGSFMKVTLDSAFYFMEQQEMVLQMVQP